LSTLWCASYLELAADLIAGPAFLTVLAMCFSRVAPDRIRHVPKVVHN